MPTPSFELIDLTEDTPHSPGEMRLQLRGDWIVAELKQVNETLASLVSNQDQTRIRQVSLRHVQGMDTAGAFVIDRLIRELGDDLELVEATDRVRALLFQAREIATREEHPPPPLKTGSGLMDLLERTGRQTVHLWEESVATLAFVGETLASVARVLSQPWRMRWTALVSVMEESGLDAVPIVAFLSFFVGMVVAFIGASTLAEFGATIFVVELVGIAVLREFGVVLAAIILVGRTNSAFTAQIGAMKMRQEIDAMTTLGLNPVDVIVAPRIIAMVLMTPVLAFIGVLAGLAGGVVVGWLALDINPTVFFNRMQAFVPIQHFWVGMSKAPVFGFIIALIGCRQGLEVGGSVQSLGGHTTKSVVQAIFAIIVVDAMFALMYLELDI
ncbi:MAG: ABC transporter permease [Pseudomonadota bacterium]